MGGGRWNGHDYDHLHRGDAAMIPIKTQALSRLSLAGDELVHIPKDLALLQASYQAGVTTGRREGYVLGYEAGRVHAKPEARNAQQEETTGAGMRRKLLGLPCPNCRCYFLADEAHCPCCKRPLVTAITVRSISRG